MNTIPYVVKWATTIYAFELVFAVILNCIYPVSPTDIPVIYLGRNSTITIIALSITLNAWLLYKVCCRKTWARRALAVWWAVGFVSNWSNFYSGGSSDYSQNTISALALACQTVALSLLFSPSSNAWFASRGSADGGSRP